MILSKEGDLFYLFYIQNFSLNFQYLFKMFFPETDAL